MLVKESPTYYTQFIGFCCTMLPQENRFGKVQCDFWKFLLQSRRISSVEVRVLENKYLRIDVRGKSNSIYTISLFESGRIQSTGGCRSGEVKRAMMKISRRLVTKLNYDIKFCNFEIQNILAVYDCRNAINLNAFVAEFDGVVDYEPDRFPAARVRIPIPPLVHDNAVKHARKSPSGDEAQSPSNVQDSASARDSVSSLKIRRLLMGELETQDDQTQASYGEAAVGSYMITSGSKRSYISGRMNQDKQARKECVTANVFSTGKITFTGGKSIRSLKYVLDKLRPIVEPDRVCHSAITVGECENYYTVDLDEDEEDEYTSLCKVDAKVEENKTDASKASHQSALQARIQQLQKEQLLYTVHENINPAPQLSSTLSPLNRFLLPLVNGGSPPPYPDCVPSCPRPSFPFLNLAGLPPVRYVNFTP